MCKLPAETSFRRWPRAYDSKDRSWRKLKSVNSVISTGSGGIFTLDWVLGSCMDKGKGGTITPNPGMLYICFVLFVMYFFIIS